MNQSNYSTPDSSTQNLDASDLPLISWVWISAATLKPEIKSVPPTASQSVSSPASASTRFSLLKPMRSWLDQVDVHDAKIAHRLCRMIPSQCPFERDVTLFGHTLFHIPPMCKLNPLYDEVVALRFRALCYLADECGEDVTIYC
jgi:hypothetical protein